MQIGNPIPDLHTFHLDKSTKKGENESGHGKERIHTEKSPGNSSRNDEKLSVRHGNGCTASGQVHYA